MPKRTNEVIDFEFFTHVCDPFTVSPALVYSIAMVESGLDPNTARYEPLWRYHYKTEMFAKDLGITKETEHVLQSISWGLMQVMGTVARELDFDRHLTELTNPHFNVFIGIKKLEQLFGRYDDLDAVVSSYNQGNPRKKADGSFMNQIYVDKVFSIFNLLK